MCDDTLTEAQQMIADECDSVKALLIAKNREYGNSALEPIRIFSKVGSVEQIKVRLDDKLKRISTTDPAKAEIKEDTVQDLIGYLILYRVALRQAGG